MPGLDRPGRGSMPCGVPPRYFPMRLFSPARFIPLFAVAAFAPFTLCAEEPILIGQVAALTGNNASFGTSSDKGTRLALEEINASGGVLGRKLKLITEDNQSKPGESAAAAKKLIGGDKVAVLLGEVASSASLEMAPVAQAAHLPMISPASTNPGVTETGDYVFRVCFIDPFQGTVMSKFALENLKVRKIAILRDESSDYSQGLSKYFKEHFLAHGGEIVAERSYKAKDVDFRAQLTALRAAKPDAVFLPGYYGEVGLIAKQARRLGIKQPMLGGDGWDGTSLFAIAGHDLDGCYISNHFSAEDRSPVVQNFLKTFKVRYNEVPDTMAALGYDSLKVAADAMRRAGSTDAAKLRDAIAATKDFPGVTGAITLDAGRNAAKAAVILKVENGAFRYFAPVAP